MADMTTIITQEGKEKLEEELQYLKVDKRKEVAEKLKEARAQGDLSENAEYDAAKEELAFLEGRIMEISDFLAHAVVSSPTSTDVVDVGCRVRCKAGGKEKEYHIVGARESDPTSGKISNESPLGIALLGRKKGERFENVMPNGNKLDYGILDISC